MSVLSGRIKLQYQPTETESENDLIVGKNEYFLEITQEKGKSCLH